MVRAVTVTVSAQVIQVMTALRLEWIFFERRNHDHYISVLASEERTKAPVSLQQQACDWAFERWGGSMVVGQTAEQDRGRARVAAGGVLSSPGLGLAGPVVAVVAVVAVAVVVGVVVAVAV